MWELLSSSPSIDAAFARLLEEFEVEPELLRTHLTELLSRLQEHGLLNIATDNVEPFQRYRALDSEARKMFRRARNTSSPRRGISAPARLWEDTGVVAGPLGAPQPGLAANRQQQDIVENTCRMVRAAVHYGLPGASCLEASLTLWYLLRLQEFPRTCALAFASTRTFRSACLG